MRSSSITGALVVTALCAAAACHRSAAPAAPRRAAVTAEPSMVRAAPALTDAPGPPVGRRRVTVSSSIVLLEPVRFGVASPTIDPRSAPMLDAVADTLVAHTDLERIEVRADGADAPAGARQQLGLARAVRIVDALVARGVARARLWPVGNVALSSTGPELVIVRRRGGR